MKKTILENIFVASLISFFLIYFETLENWALFNEYCPRGKTFQIIFTPTNIKFLLGPCIKLTVFTLLIYFVPIYLITHIILVIYRHWTQHKQGSKLKARIFTGISFYIFLYLAYTVNAFLIPGSLGRHYIFYWYLFPIFNTHDPLSIPHLIFLFLLASFCFSIVGYYFFLVRKNKRMIFGSLLTLITIIAAFFIREANYQKTPQFTQEGNVIILGMDSFQYNNISKKWGYEKDLAPHTTAFLDEAVCFTNAWTPFSRTNPSYMSLFTSRYPVNNGIRANLLPLRYLSKDNQYLGSIMQKHGYFTFHATDDVRFSNVRHIHGFDRIYCPKKNITGMLLTAFYDYAFSNILLYYDIFPGIFDCVRNARAHMAFNPKAFARNVVRELKKLPKDQPQFIVIHFCSNHHPYTSPYPYERDPELTLPLERTIRMTDDQMQIIMDFIKKSGLYDRSTIVLMSDHGSGWEADFPSLSHGTDFEKLWASRIMLAMHNKKFNTHKKIPALVRHFDLYPTILEMHDIPIPENIDGISLLRLMEGHVDTPRSLYAESGYSYKYTFKDNYWDQDIGVSAELKNFIVDPEFGYVYITDEDYEELVEKKWYMLLENDIGLKYNPWYDEKELFKLEDKTAVKFKNKKLMQEMLQKLETYRLKGEDAIKSIPGQEATRQKNAN